MGAESSAKQSHRRASSSRSSEDNVLASQIATGEENAVAIADEVYAWKVLTKGEGPLWQRFNKEEKEKASRRQSLEESKSGKKEGAMPEGHPPVDPYESRCPFDAMAHLDEPQDTSTSSARRRPESLPTPPPAQERFASKSFLDGSQNTNLSPPLSIPGSASKCPIRLLDERSPEEIAEYFETHKHEIPRSHEICVKRYQSNAESIRQLDAKYGSLVNMLQGLGMKHQPLLPAKEDEEALAEMDAKSAKKVENWAGNVKESHDVEASADQEDLPSSSVVDTEERQGHFDRPLKEIRVGESPSRPWGISVPGGIASFRNPNESEEIPTPRVTAPNVAPQSQAKKATNERPEGTAVEKPQMVFTGPVFIGYGAEQAADLIKKCGWDPQGSDRGNI